MNISFPHLDVWFDDNVTPKECEDAITGLRHVIHAQRVRAYCKAREQLSAQQEAYNLNIAMYPYEYAFGMKAEEENKLKFMGNKCVLCGQNAGKYLYCTTCESKRTIQKQFNVPNPDYENKNIQKDIKDFAQFKEDKESPPSISARPKSK